MSLIQSTVSIAAIACMALVVSACGPGHQTPSASSAQDGDAKLRLASAQLQANTAIQNANVVVSTPPPGSDCVLQVVNSGSPAISSAALTDLQSQLQTIMQDLQQSDQSALDADLKKAFDAFTADLGGMLADIEKCIPANSSNTVNPPAQSVGSGVNGLQGFGGLTQLLGQQGGVH